MPEPSPLATDARLAALDRAIPGLDEAGLPEFPPSGAESHAAVSLILRPGPELETLLIKRAEAEGDPWSGHMALPGGRRDPTDEDLLATATREALEETGIDLARTGHAMGRLQALEPSTFRLPPISIFPFVFAVPGGTRARVASPEVEEVLWAPLSQLHGPEAAGTVNIQLGSTTKAFPCLRVEGRVIWGLTYRILKDLFLRLEAHAPELLDAPGGSSP